MNSTETTLYNALWMPGWYEMDQPLQLHQRSTLWFFQNPPSDLPDVEQYDFVFFNQLSAATNCQVRKALIKSITHPELGPIQQIDTQGLDYVIFTASGDAIVVNAEESPGSAKNAATDIQNWSMAVSLADVSEPLMNAS